MNRILIVLLLSTLSAGAAPAPLPESSAALADAEREFAAAGLRDGVQKSFLAHFAADAIVLHPFAVPAVEYYRGHPDRPGTRLIWAPQYVAVAASGDLGLSSGPWRFEAERDGKPVVAHGHFFSIWRREGQGPWQVLFDHGINHDAASTAVETTPLVALAPGRTFPATGGDGARRRAQLIAADEALRGRLAHDPRNGYAGAARRDTLWLREGALPQRAPRPPPPAKGSADACGCGPRVQVGLSASGDFGYVIGGNASERAKGVDVRVWRFEERRGWTLLADLAGAVE